MKEGSIYKLGDKLDAIAASITGTRANMVRDFFGDDKTAVNAIKPGTQTKVKVAAGIEAIKKNSPSIIAGDSIKDLPKLKNDTAFLVGSGGSLRKWIDKLPRLQKKGTVIATNRSLMPFIGYEEKLDYAFICDAQSNLFTESPWWNKFDAKKTSLISAHITHPSVIKKQWKSAHWFGFCAPNLPEFANEEKAQNIDKPLEERLDGSCCSLFSQLHLCARLGAKRIYLVGHDFSLVNYYFHFSEKFHPGKHLRPGSLDFSPEIATDIHGNGILSISYLLRAAKSITAATYFLNRAGVEIVNATDGGVIKAGWIDERPLGLVLS